MEVWEISSISQTEPRSSQGFRDLQQGPCGPLGPRLVNSGLYRPLSSFLSSLPSPVQSGALLRFEKSFTLLREQKRLQTHILDS